MNAPRIGPDQAPPRTPRSLGRALLGVAIGCIAIGVMLIAPIIRVEHLQFQEVRTRAMRPLAQRGDLIVAQETSTGSLHVGEYVALSPPGGGAPVIHRITSLTRADGVITITTRADGSTVADPWGAIPIPPSSPTLRLVRVVPGFGFVAVWAHDLAASGRTVIIVGAAALLIAVAAVSLLPPPSESRRRHRASWSS